jgi:hypothetical protein
MNMSQIERVTTTPDQVAADSERLAVCLILGTNKDIWLTARVQDWVEVGHHDPAAEHLLNQIKSETAQFNGARSGVNEILRRYGRHLGVSGPASQFGIAVPEIGASAVDLDEDSGPTRTESAQSAVTSIDYSSGSLTLKTTKGLRDIAYARISNVTGVSGSAERIAELAVRLQLPESFDRPASR